MWVISFSCPFPLFLAVFCFSSPSPVVQGHMGKMKPNRGEKWNIDFFPPFFLSSLKSWCRFQVSSFSRIIPSVLLPAMSSHNSLLILFFFFFFLFDEVSRGLSYSSQGVKCVKWREWVCAFVCFSESCTGWPVPDDQEPRRLSKCPRCAGDRVQKRFVGSPHVSPVDPSISLHLSFTCFCSTVQKF